MKGKRMKVYLTGQESHIKTNPRKTTIVITYLGAQTHINTLIYCTSECPPQKNWTLFNFM